VCGCAFVMPELFGADHQLHGDCDSRRPDWDDSGKGSQLVAQDLLDCTPSPFHPPQLPPSEQW